MERPPEKPEPLPGLPDDRESNGRDEAGKPRPPRYRALGLAAGLGSLFVGCVVAGILAGLGADRLLGTKPWGVVTGIVLGSVAAYWNLIRVLGRLDEAGPGERNGNERNR